MARQMAQQMQSEVDPGDKSIPDEHRVQQASSCDMDAPEPPFDRTSLAHQ